VHIFSQIDLRLERLNDSPPQRNAVIPFARAAALRSTALATSLALAVGLAVFPLDAWAKPKVPLPKPRPIGRNVVPKSPAQSIASPAVQPGAPAAPAPVAAAPAAPAAPAPAPPVLAPATRQHAALPSPRKHVAPAAVAATSSTSQA